MEYSTGGAKEREGADTGGEEEQKRHISHRWVKKYIEGIYQIKREIGKEI